MDDDDDRDHHHRPKANDALGPGTFLRVVRGDQLSFDVTVQSPGILNFDLHNYQIYFTAKSSLNSPRGPVLKKSKADGSIAIIHPHECRITLSSQDTGSLPNQSLIYKFDVRIQDLTGTVFTVFSGDLEVRASSSAPIPGINFPL